MTQFQSSLPSGPRSEYARAYVDHFEGTCADTVVSKDGIDILIYGVQPEDLEEFPELKNVQEVRLWKGGIEFAMMDKSSITFDIP